ncbi:MAG: helix-turn-helix domain-containing protein [Phycisphaerae bacterium]|nr:helix-turn-helix domain-containing protein [Phycisphaerae bacterium]
MKRPAKKNAKKNPEGSETDSWSIAGVPPRRSSKAKGKQDKTRSELPPGSTASPASQQKCKHKKTHFEPRSHKFTTNRSRRLPFFVTIPTTVCDQCGHVEQLGDSAAIDKQACEQACRDLHLLMGSEITAIRESLGLSRRKFAALAGVGVTTLARWERGSAIQNIGYDHLFRLLRHPENVERLAALRDVRLPRSAHRADAEQLETNQSQVAEERSARPGCDFSKVAADAEAELVRHIKTLPPAAFADVVTTLFGGLGYVITPFAGGSADESGGFLAAVGTDPLGIIHPQVRVIIRTSQLQDTDVARMEPMLKVGELGTLIAQIGATQGAHDTACAASKRIQIMDAHHLSRMWTGIYEELTPAQQSVLPLQKLSFFAAK